MLDPSRPFPGVIYSDSRVRNEAPSKPAKKEPPQPVTWKRLLLIMSFFLLLVVLPVSLLSNGMMEHCQSTIDREPNTPFNRWLQLATADACYRTFRPGMAADYYRRFWERYPTDERRPYAWLRYAQSLEDSARSADAISAYQKYINDYPDREDKNQAAAGIERIKFVRP